MGGDAVSEEGVLVGTTGAIDELIGDDDMAGWHFLAKGSDGGDGDDPADVERAECPDVCAVVDFVGEEAVAEAVAGEEEYGAVCELAFDDFIGRVAEGGFDAVAGDDLEGVDFIEAGASDDGECRRCHAERLPGGGGVGKGISTRGGNFAICFRGEGGSMKARGGGVGGG